MGLWPPMKDGSRGQRAGAVLFYFHGIHASTFQQKALIDSTIPPTAIRENPTNSI